MKIRNMGQGSVGFWCPGCNTIHAVTASLQFDGNTESPTFGQPIMVQGKQKIRLPPLYQWAGAYLSDASGKPLQIRCISNITAGQIKFSPICTHTLKGQTVPLPDFPA